MILSLLQSKPYNGATLRRRYHVHHRTWSCATSFVLIVVFAILCPSCIGPFSSFHSCVDAFDESSASNNNILEVNPNYFDPKKDDNYDGDDEGNDSYDDEYDDEYDDDNEQESDTTFGSSSSSSSRNSTSTSTSSSRKQINSKSIISSALSKTNETGVVKFVHNHKIRIVMVVLLYTFRKDLYRLFSFFVTVPIRDSNTGKVIGRKFHLTKFLKVVFFGYMIIQQVQLKLTERDEGEDDEYENNYSSMPSSSPFRLPPHPLSFFELWKLLKNVGNSKKHNAYIPPIEQHWTFERINDRYYKDAAACEKALTTNAYGSSSSSSGTEFSPSSLVDTHSSSSSSSSTTINTASSSTSSSSYSQCVGTNDAPKRTFGSFVKGFFGSKNSKEDVSSTSSASNDTDGLVVVMDLTKILTTSISRMDLIQDQVSLLLSLHNANQMKRMNAAATASNPTKKSNGKYAMAKMEVIVLLESGGGGVADYGLAAQHLLRLKKEPGVTLTICVDKVAASGGYMMAATGHQILAAPFAMVGSIGVYGQILNVQQLLEGWGIKGLVFRAGKRKAPLGMIGNITAEGTETVQSMVDDTHNAFKDWIVSVRPSLDKSIDKIATGEVWLAWNGVDVGLVDRLITSSEYIGERIEQGAKVLKLIPFQKPTFLGIMSGSSSSTIPPYSSTTTSWNGIGSSILHSIGKRLEHFFYGSASYRWLEADLDFQHPQQQQQQQQREGKDETFAGSTCFDDKLQFRTHSTVTNGISNPSPNF